MLVEEVADGTLKYAFSNLPADTSRIKAVRLWHERWKIEQGYQQMKEEELGLDHFEGRSRRGFHHHAALVILAFGFLALGTTPCQAEAAEKKPPAPLSLITLPAIRRGLQHLLAPRAKPDCPYCRLHLLSNQLTE